MPIEFGHCQTGSALHVSDTLERVPRDTPLVSPVAPWGSTFDLGREAAGLDPSGRGEHLPPHDRSVGGRQYGGSGAHLLASGPQQFSATAAPRPLGVVRQDPMTKRSPFPEKPPGEHYSVPTDVPAGLIPIGEELSRLEETARFSAQAQFETAKSWARWNFILGVPASVFGLFSGGAAFTEAFPVWVVGGGALIGAALAGILTVIGAERRATRAKTCANTFHDIQDEARRLLLINLASMNPDEGHAALMALCDRYSETRHAADAPARRFYNRAKKNITAGGQQFAIDAVKVTAARTAPPPPPGRAPLPTPTQPRDTPADPAGPHAVPGQENHHG